MTAALAGFGTGEYRAVPRSRPHDRFDDEPDDAGWELVARHQAGDRDAFGLLYERYRPEVHRYLTRLRDAQFADDHTNEVFLRALRRIDDLTRQGRSPGAWLHRIARNLTIDETTKRRRYQMESATNADLGYWEWLLAHHDREQVDDPVADQVSARDDYAELIAALDSLSPAHREVLVARYLQEKSTKEVADAMGSNAGAIKATVYRALRALRRKYRGGAGM